MSDLTFINKALDERLCLVDFHKTDTHTLQSLIEQALTKADEFLEHLPCAQNGTQALDIIRQFNVLNDTLSRYYKILSHLNSVVSTSDLRHARHIVLPKLSAFYTKLGQSTALYQLYQQIDQELDINSDDALRRSTALALRDFKLSGIDLDEDKKAQYAQIASELSTLSAKFSDNVLDASQAFALPLTQAQLAGITPTGLSVLKSAGDSYKANHPNTVLATDYVATLDMPMYLAIMQYADDRKLRETLYHAYGTRASSENTDEHGKFDNSGILTQILQLRAQKAALLGFDDYTQLSLAKKMATDKEEVADFLLNLAHHAMPFAKADMADLQILGKTLGLDKIEPWDIAYLSEKIRQERYNLSSEALRPYFPLPVVLAGLFDIINKLFGVTFDERTQEVPRWHDEVQFFELQDNGKTIGALYLDLFARAGKSGGAWLSDFQSKHLDSHSERLPVGFIVGNFTPASQERPSLLTFDEVTTLFHEFGHGLHHLLTKITLSDVAGISGVEWDAVELPSQFMENFAISKEGLSLISRHIDTQESLPDDIRQALINAKNFQSGMQSLRQIEFGLFDMFIHSQPIDSYEDVLAILEQVRQQVAVVIPPKNNRFANAFSHIFAGGYASGYYSYKWAELLSADAFSKFEETGIFNADTGRAFKEEILARGGSRSAKENFEAFMDRPKDVNALSRQLGFI